MGVSLASGFETGSLLEASATSNASITSALVFSGDRSCQLTSGGYVYYTISESLLSSPRFNVAVCQPTAGTGTISVIKLTTASHTYEVKAVSTGGIYGLEYWRDSVKVTAYLSGGGPAGFLQTPRWERFTMVITADAVHVLVNTKTCLIAPFADGLSQTVTRMTVTAGTSTMYIDDVTIHTTDIFNALIDLPDPIISPAPIFTTLSIDAIPEDPSTNIPRIVSNYHLAVLPLRPAIDVAVQLTKVGSGLQNADVVSDLEIGDTGYVKSTGVSTTYSDTYTLDNWPLYVEEHMEDWTGVIGTRLDASGNRLQSPFVIGAIIDFFSRQTLGNDVYVYCTLNVNDETRTSLSWLQNTAYQHFSRVVRLTNEEINNQTPTITLNHVHGTTSREIRTTALSVCVLALLEDAPTSMSSEDSYKASYSVTGYNWSGGSVIIKSNIKAALIGTALDNLDVEVFNNGGTLSIDVQSASWLSRFNTTYPYTENVDVEIIYHRESVSVYFNDRWQHTFPLERVVTPSELELQAASSGTITIQNLVVTELSDWREAVWIEYEVTGDSAIQSIIQERPVVKTPKGDNTIAYYLTPPDMTALQIRNIREHQVSSDYGQYSGSDALVYYADVKSITLPEALETVGFHTTVLQLSSLDTGATKAAKIILSRNLQNMVQHAVEARLDLRFEEGDIALIAYTASGTGEVEASTFFVVSKSFSITDKGSRMNISGRQISSEAEVGQTVLVDDLILEVL